MPDKLEISTERLITAIGSVKEWAEHVLGELKTRQRAFQEGRAEIDRALAELSEQRANFIKESSLSMSSEASHALDVLSSRMESLLADAPKAEPVNAPEPQGAPQAPAAKAAPRTVAAIEEADEFPEAAGA